jgi:hypothetical protein
VRTLPTGRAGKPANSASRAAASLRHRVPQRHLVEAEGLGRCGLVGVAERSTVWLVVATETGLPETTLRYATHSTMSPTSATAVELRDRSGTGVPQRCARRPRSLHTAEATGFQAEAVHRLHHRRQPCLHPDLDRGRDGESRMVMYRGRGRRYGYGRPGRESEAITGPGRGHRVRFLAACCPWRSSSPSASVWRGACETPEVAGSSLRLAT